MKAKAKIASRFLRFKAFLIDIFLLYVPILYLFYFALGSKEAFLNNQFIIFLCPLLFGFLQALFLIRSAQSPGLKAYDLYLINIKTGKKLNFFQIIFRYIIFIVSFGLLIGFIVSFLRKDTLTLHDVLSQSAIVVKVKNE
ncbi:RDD family protein [Campylobacter volucris]|uniref:RDD family protein n=1 Tax=Campylobacter volucris TaxID=1031542 RepID=UPI00189FA49E|nr:RDD family protein [Campylobacter volucris]MBF7069063.1 RDD family protein [Campylobacter volucris]